MVVWWDDVELRREKEWEFESVLSFVGREKATVVLIGVVAAVVGGERDG